MFLSLFTNLGKTGSYFVETVFSGFPPNILRQLGLNPLWNIYFPDEQMALLVG